MSEVRLTNTWLVVIPGPRPPLRSVIDPLSALDSSAVAANLVEPGQNRGEALLHLWPDLRQFGLDLTDVERERASVLRQITEGVRDVVQPSGYLRLVALGAKASASRASSPTFLAISILRWCGVARVWG